MFLIYLNYIQANPYKLDDNLRIILLTNYLSKF